MSQKFTGPGVTDWRRTSGGAKSLCVKQTVGSGGAWVVELQMSMDKVTIADAALTHTDVTPGDGEIMTSGAYQFNAPYQRVKVVSTTAAEIEVHHAG